MKVTDHSPAQLATFATAAGLKLGVLKVIGAALDLDVEIRDGKPVSIAADGSTTELMAHLASLPDGSEIVATLNAGEAAPELDTSLLDNHWRRRFGHLLPESAREAAKTTPAPQSNGGLDFPAQGGTPPSPTHEESFDKQMAERQRKQFEHVLNNPKGAK